VAGARGGAEGVEDDFEDGDCCLSKERVGCVVERGVALDGGVEARTATTDIGN